MTVHEAVKELRAGLRLSQQAFATKLGLSISAIQNYEKNRIPVPRVLAKLDRLAQKEGLYLSAETFRRTLENSIQKRISVNRREDTLSEVLLIVCRNTHIPGVEEHLRSVIGSLLDSTELLLEQQDENIEDTTAKEIAGLRREVEKLYVQSQKPRRGRR